MKRHIESKHKDDGTCKVNQEETQAKLVGHKHKPKRIGKVNHSKENKPRKTNQVRIKHETVVKPKDEPTMECNLKKPKQEKNKDENKIEPKLVQV